MEFEPLRKQLEEAIAQGLQDLQVHVVAMHPETYRRTYEGPVVDEDVVDSYRTQRDLMKQLRQLVGSDPHSDDQPRIHWYSYVFDHSFDASMALYSDRTVQANQEGHGSRWVLREVQWKNYAQAPMPAGTQPPSEM